ncbi:hypothetical protein HY032_03370, partial [Candidatus Gottesmanbacteria bacterium]|nr:hypothetical protein [Candidatus Gottesmanbacteria bacterium]
NVAGQRLNGQSVTGRILEGATVTGIGVGFEIFVQNAFSAALGEILAHIPGLGGKAAGIRKVDVRTPVVAGSNTFTTDTFTQPIDANRNVISSDLRTNLRTLLVERLGAEKSGLRMHLVNSLMEGFDDTAVLVMYGLVNRMMGNMLPRIPTEYYGASLALDFLGIGQSPDGTKTDATASVSEAPAAAQSPGIREKFTKGVEFGRGILNYSNPVTLYGLSVMKAGATTYLDTLKAVRAKRKEVESGRAPRVYVGEGAPRGYGQQHRPWEHRRDDRYRGNQGRGGNHG